MQCIVGKVASLNFLALNKLLRIKFHKKMPEEPQLRVPKVLKIKKRKSLPDLLNYEEFKNKNDFKQFVLADIEDNKDREWVRKIWNR